MNLQPARQRALPPANGASGAPRAWVRILLWWTYLHASGLRTPARLGKRLSAESQAAAHRLPPGLVELGQLRDAQCTITHHGPDGSSRWVCAVQPTSRFPAAGAAPAQRSNGCGRCQEHLININYLNPATLAARPGFAEQDVQNRFQCRLRCRFAEQGNKQRISKGSGNS